MQASLSFELREAKHRKEMLAVAQRRQARASEDSNQIADPNPLDDPNDSGEMAFHAVQLHSALAISPYFSIHIAS